MWHVRLHEAQVKPKACNVWLSLTYVRELGHPRDFSANTEPLYYSEYSRNIICWWSRWSSEPLWSVRREHVDPRITSGLVAVRVYLDAGSQNQPLIICRQARTLETDRLELDHSGWYQEASRIVSRTQSTFASHSILTKVKWRLFNPSRQRYNLGMEIETYYITCLGLTNRFQLGCFMLSLKVRQIGMQAYCYAAPGSTVGWHGGPIVCLFRTVPSEK